MHTANCDGSFFNLFVWNGQVVNISWMEYELSDVDILYTDGITSSDGPASTEFLIGCSLWEYIFMMLAWMELSVIVNARCWSPIAIVYNLFYISFWWNVKQLVFCQIFENEINYQCICLDYCLNKNFFFGFVHHMPISALWEHHKISITFILMRHVGLNDSCMICWEAEHDWIGGRAY